MYLNHFFCRYFFMLQIPVPRLENQNNSKQSTYKVHHAILNIYFVRKLLLALIYLPYLKLNILLRFMQKSRMSIPYPEYLIVHPKLHKNALYCISSHCFCFQRYKRDLIMTLSSSFLVILWETRNKHVAKYLWYWRQFYTKKFVEKQSYLE